MMLKKVICKTDMTIVDSGFNSFGKASFLPLILLIPNDCYKNVSIHKLGHNCNHVKRTL